METGEWKDRHRTDLQVQKPLKPYTIHTTAEPIPHRPSLLQLSPLLSKPITHLQSTHAARSSRNHRTPPFSMTVRTPFPPYPFFPVTTKGNRPPCTLTSSSSTQLSSSVRGFLTYLRIIPFHMPLPVHQPAELAQLYHCDDPGLGVVVEVDLYFVGPLREVDLDAAGVI